MRALAGALALLVSAGAANAQIAAKLVSNNGQTSGAGNFSLDYAQAFSTGGATGGYKPTGVDLELQQGTMTTLSDTDAQGDSSSAPDGTSLGSLTTSTALSSSIQTLEFGPSAAISLAGGTVYWLVVDVTGGDDANTRIGVVTSITEDPDPAPGWSIADQHYIRNTDDSNSWSTAPGVWPFVLELYGLENLGVTGVEVSSSPASGQTYDPGEKILVRLTYNAAVTVDTSGGTPRLQIDLSSGSGCEKWASYEGGTGTKTLRFAYTVASADSSPSGIAV